MRLRAWVGGLILGLGLCLLLVSAAQAVITKNLPLGDILEDSLFIFTARVEKFDPDNQRMFLVVDELHEGPVFGVIPSVLVGGPLAVLSMLFPTLFGGWKRWLAFISVVCTTSTVYFLHWCLSGVLTGTVWDSSLLLWLALTIVTFLGS